MAACIHDSHLHAVTCRSRATNHSYVDNHLCLHLPSARWLSEPVSGTHAQSTGQRSFLCMWLHQHSTRSHAATLHSSHTRCSATPKSQGVTHTHTFCYTPTTSSYTLIRWPRPHKDHPHHHIHHHTDTWVHETSGTQF